MSCFQLDRAKCYFPVGYGINMNLEVASQYAEVFGLLTIIGAIIFSWYQIEHLRQDRKSAAAFKLTEIYHSSTFAHGMHVLFNSPENMNAKEFEEFHGENMRDIVTLMTTWESIGAMIFRDELDWDLMYDYFAGAIVVTFQKTELVIQNWRDENDRQSYFEWMEWLAERVIQLESDTPPVPAHVLYKDWVPKI
jgi:hypothetical protein